MPSPSKERSAGIYVVCTQKESPVFPITARMKGRDIKEINQFHVPECLMRSQQSVI